MILSHNPAFHQILREPLSFFLTLNLLTLFTRRIPICLSFHYRFARTCSWRPSPSGCTETPSASCHGTVASGLPASPSGSSLHTYFSSPYVTAVHETSEVVPSLPCIFLEDSEHTSSICHGRRARLNGHVVSSVIPTLCRPRCSQSLQHSCSFPFAFPACEHMLLLH